MARCRAEETRYDVSLHPCSPDGKQVENAHTEVETSNRAIGNPDDLGARVRGNNDAAVVRAIMGRAGPGPDRQWAG